MKKTILGAVWRVAALVVGALIAAATEQIPFLSWLAFGRSIGLPVENPMVLDLSVIKIAFGFEIGVTVAHILCFIGALFGYKYMVKRMHLDDGRQRHDRHGKHGGEGLTGESGR